MRRVLVGLAVVLVALVVVVAVAARRGPSEQQQLVEDLRSDFEMGPEQAECVADQLYERFSEQDIAALREAGSREELSEDLLADLRTALAPCASAGS